MAEGFIEKTKGFFGFGAVESYDDGMYDRDDYDGYPDREDQATERFNPAVGRHSHTADRFDDRYVGGRRGGSAPLEDRTSSAYATSPMNREPELVVVGVSSYRDAGKVTPEFRRGDIVAFNLGALDKADGNQFLAFVMGVASALDGKVEKLDGVRNFALLPSGVRLTLDRRDALAAKLGGER